MSETPAAVPGVAAVRAIEWDVRWRAPAAGIIALQGAALIANAAGVLLAVARDGVTGPSPVASAGGVAVEIGLFLLFGAALIWVASGIWRSRGSALTPFLLAQVLGLTVALPLASASGGVGVIGKLLASACVFGAVAWAFMLRESLRQRPQSSTQ